MTTISVLKVQQFLPDEPWPEGVVVDPTAAASDPKKKNPHVHVARGVLFVQPGDMVVTTTVGVLVVPADMLEAQARG